MNTELSSEFQSLFERQIKPKLADIEKFRVSMLRVRVGLKWIAMPVLLALGVALSFAISPVAFVLAIAFGLWLIKWPVIRYSNYYKRHTLGILVTAFGDFRYDSLGGVNEEVLAGFNIYPGQTSSRSEDYITGEIDGVALEFCELKLTTSDEDKNRTIFQGCAFLLTFPFEFDGHTIVRKDKGAVLNIASSIFSSLSRVALENPEFERIFEVQSDNAHDARYLLSPGMMNRLLALNALFVKEAQGRKMSCEFKHNKCLFLLDYRGDLLQAPDITASVYDARNLPLIEKELSMIIGLVRQLKLDYLVRRKQAVSKSAS